MTKDSLKNKYSIEDWVLNARLLKSGDLLEFYSEVQSKVIVARFEEIYYLKGSNYIKCTDLNTGIEGIVDIYNTVVYVKKDNYKEGGCSCGAKYTSNPKYHMRFCDLNKE